MKAGLARKLINTYLVIIVSTIVSGAFCLYVLNANQRTNSEMRYVTLPSLENIKDLQAMNREIKKLSDTWVFITNTRDQERLSRIIKNDAPKLDSFLGANAQKWRSDTELALYQAIKANNRKILDSVRKITALLHEPDDYANDAIVDYAAELNKHTAKQISETDKLFDRLIEAKEHNLKIQQNSISTLLNSLYFILLLTIVIVIAVGVVALNYSRKYIIKPLLELNDTILDMAVGEVVAINKIDASDEIGQMHNAVYKMINGIIEKINFAEHIGKGNYETDFQLLSEKDKLGTALLTMRDDLKRSNETLTEQDKRLVAAQKLAQIGNYFYDIKSGYFTGSETFYEILGIDETFERTVENWASLISPEFNAHVRTSGLKAITEKTNFAEEYILIKNDTKKEHWVRVIGEISCDDEGNPLSMFGTMQDITASKTLEIELNQSYKIATEQNHRLLNFSYIVSHNLRMYAVNIQGLLGLYEEAESEEEKREIISYLNVASGQLNDTMTHLNDVVAMQNAISVELGPQILSKFVNNAIDLLKTQISAKNAVVLNRVQGNIVVNYNPAYLDSIILNFISNAIKYSHPDRAPLVVVDCYKEYPTKENSKWVLEINDNGIGIDMNKNGDKLFGMYKTFHGNKDAKGIGLFMTKYQIEAMGGRVEVSSELQKGTTFRIYIK